MILYHPMGREGEGEGEGGEGGREREGEGRGEMREEGNNHSKLWWLFTYNTQLHPLYRLTQCTLLTEENTGRQGNVMNDVIRSLKS